MNEPRMCLYTVLIGGYEDLLEQPVAADSALPFICFTDDPSLVSESWQIRQVDRTLPADPRRSSRLIKILPHRHLSEFDVSLYIDNSVLLTRPPEEVLSRLLPNDARMGLIAHSMRPTVRAEFDQVRAIRYDSAQRLSEQWDHYATIDPALLDERLLWTGMLARTHHDPQVVATMEAWAANVLRYSRRDQLSLPVLLRLTGLDVAIAECDNHGSSFHAWPKSVGRRPTDLITGQEVDDWVDASEVRWLERRLVEMEDLQAQLQSSASWRVTAPLRSVSRMARSILGRT